MARLLLLCHWFTPASCLDPKENKLKYNEAIFVFFVQRNGTMSISMFGSEELPQVSGWSRFSPAPLFTLICGSLRSHTCLWVSVSAPVFRAAGHLCFSLPAGPDADAGDDNLASEPRGRHERTRRGKSRGGGDCTAEERGAYSVTPSQTVSVMLGLFGRLSGHL